MEIITFNIGQGAFVVVRDNTEAVIVDTRIPATEDKTSVYLKGSLARAVEGRNVRGLMLTGFDKDHSDACGVALVVNKYRPDWVMYPKYWKDTASCSDVFKVIREAQASRRGSSRPLESISVRIDDPTKRLFKTLCTNLTFECFSPHPEDMDNSNNCSLVVKVKDRSLSYLITGDTENARWQSINRIFRTAIESDVMAAPHHGSRNGAHEGTLQLVRPDTVLISAGVNSQFGHPHSDAVALYVRYAREVYSTNAQGGQSLWTRRSPTGAIITTLWT